MRFYQLTILLGLVTVSFLASGEQFDSKSHLMDANGKKQFLGNLIPCQRQIIGDIESGAVRVSLNSKRAKLYTKIRREPKSYEDHIILGDLDLLQKLPMVHDLAWKALRMSCNGYKDDTVTNAFLHFSLSMLGALEIGETETCKITTAHEIFHSKRKKVEKPFVKIEMKFGVSAKKTIRFKKKYLLLSKPVLPWTPGITKVDAKSFSMDLVNNAAGIRYAAEHKGQAQKCLNHLKAEILAYSRIAKERKKNPKLDVSSEIKKRFPKTAGYAPRACIDAFADAQKKYKMAINNDYDENSDGDQLVCNKPSGREPYDEERTRYAYLKKMKVHGLEIIEKYLWQGADVNSSNFKDFYSGIY